MDLRFWIGLLGSVLLIIGSALPDHPVKAPWKSGRNWLFACGNIGMFLYALLGYLAGGPIFFLILQIFIACSTLFMMIGTPDRFDTPALSIVGGGLLVWSLVLFEGIGTAIFVCGLALLGIGFALQMGTARRQAALCIGSVAIAVFSVLARDWIFVILNVCFALFSGAHALRLHRSATTGASLREVR